MPHRHRPTTALLAEVDRGFRAGGLVTQAPPTRFFVNLTERCDLGCLHCLNAAPRRTATGEARDLLPEVIGALAPHLAHATYLALSHAGEPLVSPALVPLLRCLQEARRGQPFVVHLLTNGQQLTAERFAQLVELGVSSWSFSLDGMTAATHDRLRRGSQVERLLGLVEELAGLRRQRFPGTRLGIAWTVTESNLEELPALVAFAGRVGLDWVKLEELCAVNRASAALVVGDPAWLAEIVGRAREQAGALGLRLLVHLEETRTYKCALEDDPALAAFSRDDDWVNRTEINCCRVPYDYLCVEPDGDVRPIWFNFPVAGNLLRQDLAEIWNSAGFRATRQLLLAQRRCAGEPSCGRDPGPEAW